MSQNYVGENRRILIIDDEELASVAHTLEGSGGTFGYPEVTDISQRLEAAAKQRDDVQIESLLDELTAFVESSCR